MTSPSVPPEATRYCEFRRTTIQQSLGFGQDGTVWLTDIKTAIKCLEREQTFRRELACYHRLETRKVFTIAGFDVPRLIGFHFDLRVIEMETVKPPYILDFGKAYIDRPPDYSPEQLEEHEELQRSSGETTTNGSRSNWPSGS